MTLFWTKLKLLWEWIKPLLEKESLDLLTVALPVAKQAILALVGNTMTNATKKNVALAEIFKTLKSLGYDPQKLSESLIELAFNMAFRKLRDEGKV